MATDHLKRLAKALPKAELHLHIEGTLEPEMMFALAARNQVALKYSSAEELRSAYNFTNLQSFLDLYYAGTSVLCKEEDFFELTKAYVTKAAADGVKHVEIFFDPQAHLSRGIPFATIIRGIRAALEQATGFTFRIIMCFLRHLSEEDGFATLEAARPHLSLIGGVGLDSGERGNPPSKFARLFARCRELGLRVCAHAGEEGPAEYITEALDVLHAERIDHGVRCLEDPQLVARLVKEQIPLVRHLLSLLFALVRSADDDFSQTVSPLSNLRLKVVSDLAQHNLGKLLGLGLLVTVNSDDPAYFGGSVGQNFAACIDALHLTKAEVVALCRNSITASWIPAEQKAALHKEIDAVAATFDS